MLASSVDRDVNGGSVSDSDIEPIIYIYIFL